MEFQELFEIYWNAEEGSKLRMSVIEELNKYIYFYVVSKYQDEFDMASDFFVDNIDNTKLWLEEYEPSFHISFLAYFTAKIKRKILNYWVKTQKCKMYENVNEFYRLDPDAFVESVFEPKNSYKAGGGEDLRNLASVKMRDLDRDEEVALKLYYGFPLQFKDLRLLLGTGDKKIVIDSLRKYRACLKNKLESQQAQREVLLGKLYITGISLQNDVNRKTLEKREKLLVYFEEIRNLVPLRMIADIFQKSITNVQRKIKRGQKKIKDLLIDQLHLQAESPTGEQARTEKRKSKRAA